MAGIGFRLQRYFTTDSLYKNIKGSVYSIVISSGPWLITVLTVGVISYFAQQGAIGSKDLFIFKSIICYTYAASLVMFGMIEMPITRYLADKLFINDYSSFKNVYTLFALMSLLFGVALGVGFYSFFQYPFLLKLFSIALFVCVSLIWLSMVFLSAAKNYHQIVLSFFLGGALSIGLAFLLGRNYGLVGYVGGFVLGQGATATLLSLNLFGEFQGEEYFSYEVIDYFKKFRGHILVGLFYYLGIWIDKFVYWFNETGEHVDGLFYTNRFYDTAMFLAYLSIVPSLAIFLVKVETDFYIRYTYYFRAIQSKNNLAFLNDSVEEIVDSLRNTILNLIKFQLFITLTLWFFSQEILTFMRLPAIMNPIFRYGVIGSLFLSLFLIMNIVLLYFERPKKVMFNYFVFFILNLGLSVLTSSFGYKFHGLGYVVASFSTLVLSYYALSNTLKELNYYTFMRQGVLNRKEIGEEL